MPKLKVQVNTSFLFFLHEIMLCKLVRDDEFHWDQMLKNQELNLEIDELCVVASCIGYWICVIKWLEFATTCISLEIGCIGVHVSWMWVVYKCWLRILVAKLALGLLLPIHTRDSLFCSLVTYWKTPSAPLNNPSWMA